MRNVKAESCQLINNCHELLQLGTRDVQKEVWLYRSHDVLQTAPLLQAYTILCDILMVFSRNLRTNGMVIWHTIF